MYKNYINAFKPYNYVWDILSEYICTNITVKDNYYEKY